MADTNMEPNYHLFTLPRCVPPRLVVNQNYDQDDNGDERELPLFMLKRMSDDAFMQVISNMPLREGGAFMANYACRRLNRILATTARLVPVAYDPSQPPRPWYIVANWLYWEGDIGISWAYDPISNWWYKFPLPLMRRPRHRREWMWHKFASTDGLVCGPSYNSQILDYVTTYELELFDPYTQRFRTLPKFENQSTQISYRTLPAEYNEGYNLTRTFSPFFSVNIWMINPATCEYKVIVTRCMTSIAENSNHVFVDSYDQIHSWKQILRTACGMPPGWVMQGSSAICHDILYSIFHDASRGLALRGTVGYQLFLHQFDLKSGQYSSNLYPMPEFFCFPGAAVLLNCNNNLMLVGAIGEDLIATSVNVWKFNPHPAGWLRLGVMPDTLLLILNMVSAPGHYVYANLHRYSGGGNFIYFRNNYGHRVVVLDLSMTERDGLSLRVDAWKEARECPNISLNSGSRRNSVETISPMLCHDFCYEPRLLMGVPI